MDPLLVPGLLLVAISLRVLIEWLEQSDGQ